MSKVNLVLFKTMLDNVVKQKQMADMSFAVTKQILNTLYKLNEANRNKFRLFDENEQNEHMEVINKETKNIISMIGKVCIDFQKIDKLVDNFNVDFNDVDHPNYLEKQETFNKILLATNALVKNQQKASSSLSKYYKAILSL